MSILCKIKWSPLDIVIHPRYYLPHFTSPIKRYELVLAGNNTKKSKNTVMQKKYITQYFVKNADISKNAWAMYFF